MREVEERKEKKTRKKGEILERHKWRNKEWRVKNGVEREEMREMKGKRIEKKTRGKRELRQMRKREH